ncbi:class I SAM-dependent methyltransferase [Candidatus Omnitrophota bacterium]
MTCMKEEDIRKRDVFNKYLELAKEDVKRFFSDKPSFVSVNCPACDGSEFRFEFDKEGFKYVSCNSCSTLFVNPRPSFKDLNYFYTSSNAMHFLINDFFKPVEESRRDKIFKPRAEYIHGIFSGKAPGLIGDIGAGFGIFLEELKKTWPLAKSIAIEPSPEQADICRSKGLDVQCCALEELKGFEGQFDLLTAFELLEHLFDPSDFLNRVRSILKPGGYLLITTLNGQGFDIQLLWERSKSLNPPHHLNFLNPHSIPLLLERCGFQTVQVSTPGRLDWDIVEGMIKNENVSIGKFWDLLADKTGEDCKRGLQDWITKNNLSSHMMLLARKQELEKR